MCGAELLQLAKVGRKGYFLFMEKKSYSLVLIVSAYLQSNSVT